MRNTLFNSWGNVLCKDIDILNSTLINYCGYRIVSMNIEKFVKCKCARDKQNISP